MIRDLDPARADEPLFRTEPFCSILSVVSIGSDDPVAFLAEATRFCNDRLWGTLSCAITIHEAQQEDPAIALALVRPFDLLLVDEPFVGLDPQGRDAMVELLAEAHAGGAAVIVATHQLDFVQRAERCLALRDGDVVFDGPANGADVDQLVLGEH